MTSTPVGEPVYGRGGFAALSRASRLFLALGAAAIGVYFLLPADAQDVLYVAIGRTAVAAVLHGARDRGEGRLSWQLFAAGLSCAVAGDAISGYYEIHLGKEPPVPSSADVFYLASYPLLIAGIFLLL